MTPYTEKLTSALAQYEARCSIDPSFSILDALWYDYSCTNPVDDGQIQKSEAKLSPVFSELSMEASDCLTDLIVEVLNAHQRAAYLEGLRTGVHLMLELSEIYP